MMIPRGLLQLLQFCDYFFCHSRVTSRKALNSFSLPLQWDDETDMAKMEECVRSVQMDGLVWGASKLVPVGYGIKKLQIQCVVEDDKVGTDILEEEITKFEDYVSIFLELYEAILQSFCSSSNPLGATPAFTLNLGSARVGMHEF